MPKLTYPDGYPFKLYPDLENLFTDEIIDNIMERFEIPREHRDRLFNLLDMTSRDVLRARVHRDTRLTSKEVAVELKKIRDRSRKLLDLLDSISDEASYAISMAQHDVHWSVHDQPPEELLRRRAIVPIDGEYGPGWEFRDYTDLEPALAFLAHVSDEALGKIKSPPPGRPPNFHLDHFARLFCRFWARELGRTPTHEAYKGEGLTEFDSFLTSILERISPEDVRSLNSAIKRQVAEFRSREKN